MESSQIMFIVVVSVIVAAVSAVSDIPSCCGSESDFLMSYSYKCENNKTLSLPCNMSDIGTINYGYSPMNFQDDDDGKPMYLGTIVIVRSPDYCVGNVTDHYWNLSKKIALYCKSKAIYRDRYVMSSSLFVTIVALIFMVSGIFLGLTAAIYFIIPQTQDIEGRSTFHLTSNQSLSYVLGAYWFLKWDNPEVTMLEEFCVSYWYLFVFTLLAFFSWSTLLVFDMRRRFKHNSRINESILMRRYLIIAYGIPAVLVLLGNITVYAINSNSGKSVFEVSCMAHQLLMFAIYTALPIFISLLVSTFYFFSLQRLLWRARPESTAANSTNTPKNLASKLRKFKFRFLLNAKLFVLIGLPVLLIIILCFLCIPFRAAARVFAYIALFTFFFIACEGVVAFYMLVLSRKRILEGIADKLGFTSKSKQWPESEESIAYSDENENEPGREL